MIFSLIILLLCSIPIWMLILLYRILTRLEQQEQSLTRLLKRLPPPAVEAKKPEAGAPAPAFANDWQKEIYQRPKPKPLTPQEPSAFQKRTSQIFRKMINWLIINEEYRPQGVSWESAIASTWLLRMAVLIFVIGIGFLLKYSIDQGFLSPVFRIFLSTATGAAMLLAGGKMLKRQYPLLAQGLLGGGVAVLYATIYAAHRFYALLPLPIAFAAMAVVTLLTGFVSLRFNSLLVATLGLIGGYATPILFSTPQPSPTPLFGYLLLLGAGVAWLCRKRDWPILNTPAMLAAYTLIVFQLRQLEQPSSHLLVFSFLAIFFLLFQAAIVVPLLEKKTSASLFDVSGMLLNAAGFMAVAYQQATMAHAEYAAAGLCVFYSLMTLFLYKRARSSGIPSGTDQPLFTLSYLLAAFFLAYALLLAADRAVVPLLWALQAALLFLLGTRVQGKPLQWFSVLLSYAILCWCAFTLLNTAIDGPPDTGATTYLPFFLRHFFQTGLPILLIGGTAVYAFHTGFKDAAAVLVFMAYALFFAFLSLELWYALSRHLPQACRAGLSLLWACYALLTLFSGLRWKNAAFRYVALGLFAVVVYKVFVMDLRELDLVVRIIAFLLLGGLLFTGSWFYLRAGRGKAG